MSEKHRAAPRRSKSRDGFFPETDWNNVRRLRGAGSEERLARLDELARSYWKPLFWFLLGQGNERHHAEDLVQGFFEHALSTGLFLKADLGRGRFRTFLLSCLRNYAANIHRAAVAKARRPAGGFVSFEEMTAEADEYFRHPFDSVSPDAIFHRRWIDEVLARALHRIEHEWALDDRLTHYVLFRKMVIEVELEGRPKPDFGIVASALRLEYKEAANQLLTARRAFDRIVREEIAAYSGSADEASADYDELLRRVRATSGPRRKSSLPCAEK